MHHNGKVVHLGMFDGAIIALMRGILTRVEAVSVVTNY
jgi:uncharacterized protein YbcI